MTPFLEWTGNVLAAVSAVHALAPLVRVWRQKTASHNAVQSDAALEAEGLREGQVERAPIARINAPRSGVTVRIELAVRVVPADTAADAERGAW
ncbi:hypothetical protein [Streptomyces sp. NPDC054829]